MKKYLLLASVAGCLLNVGNAWADDFIPGTDGYVTVNASATISHSCTLFNMGNFAFGTIGVMNGDYDTNTALVTMATDGSITKASPKVVSFASTGSPASVSALCATAGANFVVTCANGTGDPTGSDKCPFGDSKLAIGNVTGLDGTVPTVEGDFPSIGATLYAGENFDYTVGAVTGPAIKVTVEY